jgi:folate-dependent phosphoribosylglycinamide formyltransferase PurN
LSFLYTTLITSLFLFSASGELLVSIIFAIISNQVFKIVIDILKSKNKKSEFLDVIALEKTMVYVCKPEIYESLDFYKELSDSIQNDNFDKKTFDGVIEILDSLETGKD